MGRRAVVVAGLEGPKGRLSYWRLDMIRSYLDRALARARYSELEDGSYCAVVPGLRGVIATGQTLERCRAALQEVIEEWILVRVARGLDVPTLGGLKIRVRKAG
jgi:predicted RNase H-like HicB family nuclease